MSIAGFNSTSGLSWWSEASTTPATPTLATIPTASSVRARPWLKNFLYMDSPLNEFVRDDCESRLHIERLTPSQQPVYDTKRTSDLSCVPPSAHRSVQLHLS